MATSRGLNRSGTDTELVRPRNPLPLSGVVDPVSAAGRRGAVESRGSSAVPLSQFLENGALVHYLLHTNTFFHGKIGFYKQLLARIHQAAGIDPTTITYLQREEDLAQRKDANLQSLERINLMPIVESEDALNRLVALALRKVKPVWLIAPLFAVKQHLLIAFSNFFVSGTPDELHVLQDIFQLEVKSLENIAKASRTNEWFISDYQAAGEAEKTNNITVIPLEFPELPLVTSRRT